MQKMNFIEFVETIQKMARAYFSSSDKVEITDVYKNNGMKLTGLCIKYQDKKMTPLIYLNYFYSEYLSSGDVDAVFGMIVELFDKHIDGVEFDEDDFLNFEKASERITYRLINYKSNSHMLKSIPHRRVLDLAVVYYYIVSCDEECSASAVISYEQMERWRVDESMLYKLARENTPKIFPYKLQSIQEAIKGAIPFDIGYGEKSLDIMYVLSNNRLSNGASCMIYPKVLSRFASEIDEDLYIIPSSIHEVLLVPQSMVHSVLDLKELVVQVNSTELALQEVLSETIYAFNREDGVIEIA